MEKAVELIFHDGSCTGRVSASIPNWAGEATRIPRSILTSPLPDLVLPGLYLLIQPGAPAMDSVYFGETENLQRRLEQHITDYNSGKERYYWDKAIAFTGPLLGKTELLYLENRFVSVAREAKQCAVLTQETHLDTPISDVKRIAADEYFEQAKFLLEVLGYSYLHIPMQPMPENNYPVDTSIISCYAGDPDKTLVIEEDGTRHVETESYPSGMAHMAFSMRHHSFGGKGEFLYDGKAEFCVFPGAIINQTDPQILKKCVHTRCHWVTKQPMIFDTPTEAASFIAGEPLNGYFAWIHSSGVSLQTLRNFKMAGG